MSFAKNIDSALTALQKKSNKLFSGFPLPTEAVAMQALSESNHMNYKEILNCFPIWRYYKSSDAIYPLYCAVLKTIPENLLIDFIIGKTIVTYDFPYLLTLKNQGSELYKLNAILNFKI